jgi:chorismate dehydratase
LNIYEEETTFKLILFLQKQIMNLLKISAVSYLNTIPFVYGILKSGHLENFRLDLDVPSVCAEKLKTGVVDVALVPAGAFPDFENPVLISEYCIGAVGKVRTVLLLSQKPLKQIDKIYLDYDSRTSVQLVKVLAEHYWNISPKWKSLNPGQSDHPEQLESLVAIGDKTFELVKEYKYVYDLAEEWIRFTSLPFVFAAWLTLQPIPEQTLESLNNALAWGVGRKAESLEFFKDKLPACRDCLSYLENNISFQLDEEKKKGMQLFLNYIS